MVEHEESDGESLTTDSFFVFCKQAGLDLQDLEVMTIGMCLDYIYEFIKFKKPKKSKTKVRNATQADFDAF